MKSLLATIMGISLALGPNVWAVPLPSNTPSSSPSPGASSSPAPVVTPIAQQGCADAMSQQCFDLVCGEAMRYEASVANLPEDNPLAQRVYYCQEAQMHREAAKANGFTAWAWNGAAIACGVACGVPVAGLACPIANAAALTMDVVKTKDYERAATSALMTLIMPMAFSGGAVAAGAAKPKLNKGACAAAAMALIQAMTRDNAADEARKSALEALNNARNLDGRNTTLGRNVPPPTFRPPAITRVNPTGGGGGSLPNGNRPVANSLLSQAAKADACGKGSKSDKKSAVQCAVNNGAPGDVGTEKFAEDFKKITGEDLGNFVASGGDLGDDRGIGRTAGGSIGNALGGGGGANTLASALDDLEKKFKSDIDGTAYSSGGGSGGGESGGAGDDSAAMLAALMAGMNGGEPKPEEENKEMKFGEENREPAAMSEDDPSISIFERVTRRYLTVGNRWLKELRTLKNQQGLPGQQPQPRPTL